MAHQPFLLNLLFRYHGHNSTAPFRIPSKICFQADGTQIIPWYQCVILYKVYTVATMYVRMGASGEAVGCMIPSNTQPKRVRKRTCIPNSLGIKRITLSTLFQWVELRKVYCVRTTRDFPQMRDPGCPEDYLIFFSLFINMQKELGFPAQNFLTNVLSP